MATPRVLVTQIRDLFAALGSETKTSKELLVVEDPGRLTTTSQKILAGLPSAIKDDDIWTAMPNFVVIPDNPPEHQVERLQQTSGAVPSQPTLMSFSRFVDRLWRAPEAANLSQRDAEAAEDISLPLGMARASRPSPSESYTSQTLSFEDQGESVSALRFSENWLTGGEEALVILAGAGLGKSELTRVITWRSGLNYFQRSKEQSFNELPPVAIRVRLRDLRSSLSLKALAAHLRTELSLDGIANVDVLKQLLMHRRIALVLDGLDELDSPRGQIAEGLAELAISSATGSRIMLTSRSGYFGAEGPIRQEMGDQLIGTLEPLPEDGGVSLLRNYGATFKEAQNVVQSMHKEIRGIPLFLIWSWRSKYSGDAGKAMGPNLLEMVSQFCKRDEHRFKIAASEQVKFLEELAYTTALFGNVTREDAAVLVGDEDAPIIQGPHALLRFGDSDHLEFRDFTFEDVFLAAAIVKRWRETSEMGPEAFKSWLGDRVGEHQLSSLTMSFIAQLLDGADIAGAWKMSGEAPIRYRAYARRNLLGIALEKVQDSSEGRREKERSILLSKTLDSTDLSNTALVGLALESLDFQGWSLTECRGTGGYIAFCQFEGADTDDGLSRAELIGCTGLAAKIPERDVMSKGRRRLGRMSRPWMNPALPGGLHPRLGEETRKLREADIKILRKEGLAIRERGEGGAWFIRLTDQGKEIFSAIARGEFLPEDDRTKKLFMTFGKQG